MVETEMKVPPVVDLLSPEAVVLTEAEQLKVVQTEKDIEQALLEETGDVFAVTRAQREAYIIGERKGMASVFVLLAILVLVLSGLVVSDAVGAVDLLPSVKIAQIAEVLELGGDLDEDEEDGDGTDKDPAAVEENSELLEEQATATSTFTPTPEPSPTPKPTETATPTEVINENIVTVEANGKQFTVDISILKEIPEVYHDIGVTHTINGTLMEAVDIYAVLLEAGRDPDFSEIMQWTDNYETYTVLYLDAQGEPTVTTIIPTGLAEVFRILDENGAVLADIPRLNIETYTSDHGGDHPLIEGGEIHIEGYDFAPGNVIKIQKIVGGLDQETKIPDSYRKISDKDLTVTMTTMFLEGLSTEVE